MGNLNNVIYFYLLQSFLPKERYRRGRKRIKTTVKLPFELKNIKNLQHRDNFLLKLMKLRFGILQKNLPITFLFPHVFISFSIQIRIVCCIVSKEGSLTNKLLGELIREKVPWQMFQDNEVFKMQSFFSFFISQPFTH